MLKTATHDKGKRTVVAESNIVITVPADTPVAEINRLHALFPDSNFIAPVASTAKPPTLDDVIVQSAMAAKSLPGKLAEAWTAAGGFEFLAYIAIALVVAYGVERLVRALLLDRLVRGDAERPAAGFREKFGMAVRWTLTRLAGYAVFALVAILVGRSLPLAGEEARMFGRGLVMAILHARLLVLFLRMVVAPLAPKRRLLPFTDEEAHSIYGKGITIALITGLVAVARTALETAAGTGPETHLAHLALAVILGLATIRFFISIRRPLGALIARSATSPHEKGWGARLARNTIWIYVAFVVLDMALKSLGALELLGPEAASGSGASVMLLVIAPLIVAGLRAWADELSPAAKTPLVLGAFALVEGLVIVAIAALLFVAWGVDPFGNTEEPGVARFVPGLMEAAVVIVVGFALWRAVTILLSEKAAKAEEAEKTEAADSHGEMHGAGDRMATILPIVRGAALSLIVLTTAFTALTSLGINVAPLLASAGVLGLAIGFGAQTLVTDIISGLFYLYEDALRVGEFIETDAGGGAVEKISLRSATLRHPRGALITVPFSKMGTIRNNSRDWAVMKFSFRIPADTDVEMVRKLVKKVGEEMAHDPELKGKILAPLKSQGAVGITGRSFDIGCKFTAVPGEQFAIRRKAFAMLQRALREKGVSLAGQDIDFSSLTRPAAGA